MSMGGWGLGAGSEEKRTEEEDEDEKLDWDQAQVRMTWFLLCVRELSDINAGSGGAYGGYECAPRRTKTNGLIRLQ